MKEESDLFKTTVEPVVDGISDDVSVSSSKLVNGVVVVAAVVRLWFSVS